MIFPIIIKWRALAFTPYCEPGDGWRRGFPTAATVTVPFRRIQTFPSSERAHYIAPTLLWILKVTAWILRFIHYRLHLIQGWLLSVIDRKSTRLNSSHVAISYAVFCLKKKRIRY